MATEPLTSADLDRWMKAIQPWEVESAIWRLVARVRELEGEVRTTFADGLHRFKLLGEEHAHERCVLEAGRADAAEEIEELNQRIREQDALMRELAQAAEECAAQTPCWTDSEKYLIARINKLVAIARAKAPP